MEGEVRRGMWRCEGCEREMEERERVREEGEIEKVEPPTGGNRGDWKSCGKVLRVLQWNADGIGTKKAELEELLGRLRIDIAVIQESKLGKRSRTPVFEGFTTVRKDRKVWRKGEERKGGGVLTLVRRNLVFRKLGSWKGTTTEGLSVAVDVSRKERVVVTNVYRPPIRRIAGEDEREVDRAREWLGCRGRELIMGDLNLHAPEWGSEIGRGCGRGEAAEVVEWARENHYVVLNTGEKTRVDWRTGEESVPDVSLVVEEMAGRCKWEALSELSSDHKPIVVEYSCEREEEKKEKGLTWAWKKADWGEYAEKAKEVARVTGRTVKERVNGMTKAMKVAAEACIPRKRASRYNRPYWDDEMTELRKERNRARNGVREDVDGWKAKNQEMSKRLKEKKEKYWKEFVEGLLESDDVGKVWKTIKSLARGDKGDAPNEVLMVGDKEARTEKEKAGCFVDMYAGVSKLKLGKQERKKRVEVGRRMREYREGEEEFEVEFTMGELERALAKMGEGKKGGADGVETAMLKRLPKESLEAWLKVFNDSWKEGICPGSWKKAQIIPLLKPEKDAKEMSSYRPVSLTPVCAKLMERMVTNRLYYWLEREGVVREWQAEFQRGRGSEEQVCRLVQEVQDGWEEKPHKRTVAVALDCSKAYDRVWRVRLLERLMDEGVPGPMVRWFASFLEGRQAQVRVGGGKSKWRRLQEGLPQGAVSSPVLFLLYANDWEGFMEEGVGYSGFADDLALWASDVKVERAKERLQRALGKVERWAGVNKIQLNPTKCECCVFTRDRTQMEWNPRLVLNERELKRVEKLRFLGVDIDRGLTFAGQVEKVVGKVKKRVGVLKALAGREWGWGREELMKVYKSVVESCFWYAAAAWMPWLAKTRMEQLERAQREALRAVAGIAKSVSVECVYEETGAVPVRVEAKRRALVAYEKAVRAKEVDPRRKMCEKQSRRRLKANKGWRGQAKEECDRIVGGSTRQQFEWVRRRPWEGLVEAGVELYSELNEKVGKDASAQERERVARETVEERGKDVEMVIYTDGSVAEGVRDGGAACVTKWRGREIVERRAAGRI
jgi:hypothetical protein